jgi:hypothetical protein
MAFGRFWSWFCFMEDIQLIIKGKEVKISKIFLARERNKYKVYHIYIKDVSPLEEKTTNSE